MTPPEAGLDPLWGRRLGTPRGCLPELPFTAFDAVLLPDRPIRPPAPGPWCTKGASWFVTHPGATAMSSPRSLCCPAGMRALPRELFYSHELGSRKAPALSLGSAPWRPRPKSSSSDAPEPAQPFASRELLAGSAPCAAQLSLEAPGCHLLLPLLPLVLAGQALTHGQRSSSSHRPKLVLALVRYISRALLRSPARQRSPACSGTSR